jgi:hypothetical protein
MDGAASMADKAPTTEQLRRDIDKGRSGSKVDFPDPAAAPLGTDDEAGGTPPSPEAVRTAWRQEVGEAPVKSEQPALDIAVYVYIGIIAAIFVGLSASGIWFALSS